jgi:hypothetical protein
MFFAAVARTRAVLVNAVLGLAIVTGLAAAMVQPAMAASTGCDLINSDWAGVVTPVQDEYFLDYSGLVPGEVITYSVTTTGSTNDPQTDQYNAPGFAIYTNLGGGNYGVELEQYGGSGVELNLSGQYTVSSNPDIVLYAWSILGGGSSHASVSCLGAPVVTSIGPISGPIAGGTSVTITGNGLLNASAVRFGAANAASFTVNSATSISATAPAGGAGTVDVTVITPGGTSAISAADQYTYVAAPTVSSVTPTAGPTGSGTTVIITGTGFSAAPGTGAVKFGATNASYTINSNTQITATSPASSAGTVDVTVTTPGGTSATSAADQYTYVSAPTVTSLGTTAGPTAGGTSVVITGTGFSTATAVTFGASPAAAFVVNSNISITATAPAGAAGTVDVRVTTVGGTSATSAADQFTFVPAPTVTSVTPTAGPTSGGTVVTITGSGFAAAPGTGAVRFGATVATYTINSNTQITATSPAGTGTVDVTVTTPGGTSATSAGDQFTYVPAPTVTAIGPTAGPTAGGTTVTITGTGFAGATSVTFGATPATGFTVISNSAITATAPAGSAGTVDVRVTTVGGASATSAADQFTYVAQPSITGLSPASAPDAGGATVVIAGTALATVTDVRFGATAATSFSVNSNTQITAIAPAGVGDVDVQVTGIGGTSNNTAADDFAYLSVPDAPTIASAAPGDGVAYLSVTPPANDGNSPITTYTATASPGGEFGTAAGPGPATITVSNLTNGQAYTFTLTATNDQGTSVVSASSGSVTPKGNQTIAFSNPGSQNFGTAPTLSATSTSGGIPSFTSSTTGVCTITPEGLLTFVTAGTCTIDADEPGGTAWNAAPTVSQGFAVAAVDPGAPTIGTATAGTGDATVTFTAPASWGGTSIIDYTVTANPDGATGTAAASPITVSGLTNGVAYTFTVTARNAVGSSTASAASNAVTPRALQTITFANPGTQNFRTNPTLSASAGPGLAVALSSATTGVCTVDSSGQLTFLSAGTCTIHADQPGDTTYLPAPRVTQSFTVVAVTPLAPTSVVATAGDTQASVAFTAPADTGGSAVTSYTVTTNPPDVAPVNSAANPILVQGLTNGQAYTFTVTPNSVAGPGAASVASNSVTPKATQTITFATPSAQNFGTTPTLSATADSGLSPSFTSSTPAVCTINPGGALTFASAGTCTINADQPGNGSYLAAPQVTRSFAVNVVLPDAPGMVGATVSGTTAEITFTAPASTGGSAIIEYTAIAAPGGATVTGASSPITFGGLTGGQSYTFTVTAANVAGSGIASAVSNTVTASLAQTITFPDPGLLLAGGNAVLTAAASSGLPVSYSTTTPAICMVTTGGALTLLTAGACVIEANQAGDGTYSAAPMVSLSLAVSPGSVTLTPAAGALPDGKVGVALTRVFSGADGTAPYTFGISAGTLPAGLTLTGNIVSGTPTAAGTFSFTVTTTDANSVTASAAYTLLVVPSAVITLTPAAGALPDAMAGEDYTETVVASGNVGAVTYVATGTLPAGLAVGTTSGEISGSVDVGAQGDYSFSVTATDADANTASANYTLQVLARNVTVENKAVIVPTGSTPVPVNLTAGATGGPFSGGAVVGVSPPEAGTASITGADVAAIDSNYDAIYLKFTPNPQYTGVARITYALTSTQGASAQGIVAYTLAADLGAVAQAIQPISDGFISTRAGLLAGAVDAPGLLARRAAGNAAMPGTISVTPSGNSISMNFAASTLAANAASNAAGSLVTAPVDEGGLNFWIDGTATLHFRNDSAGDHWGSLALASVGADMLLSDDLLVGVALHTDWMDDITGASHTSGTGLLVGPYVSAELVEGVFLDVSAYYGQSWNTITSGLFSGTFETQRLLAKASLSGQWQLSDKLMLQPSANLFYLHEEAGAYAVSDGLGNSADIASFALNQLRTSLGATLRYSIDVDGNLVLTPFLGLELGLGVNNGIGGGFGTISTGFDITGLGAWTLGLGIEAGIENGTPRSISATGRARANF